MIKIGAFSKSFQDDVLAMRQEGMYMIEIGEFLKSAICELYQ